MSKSTPMSMPITGVGNTLALYISFWWEALRIHLEKAHARVILLQGKTEELGTINQSTTKP